MVGNREEGRDGEKERRARETEGEKKSRYDVVWLIKWITYAVEPVACALCFCDAALLCITVGCCAKAGGV